MNHPVRFEFSQRMVSSTVFRGKTGIYRCIVGRKRASRFKFALGTARPFLPGSGRFVIADGVWRSETVREARRTEASLDERPFFPPLSSKFLPSPAWPPSRHNQRRRIGREISNASFPPPRFLFPISYRNPVSLLRPNSRMYTRSPRTFEIFEIIYFDIEKNRCRIFLKFYGANFSSLWLIGIFRYNIEYNAIFIELFISMLFLLNFLESFKHVPPRNAFV